MQTVPTGEVPAAIDDAVVNAHVHLPPNFSAFVTPEDAVDCAAAEGVRAVGASNFHDLRVYGRFAQAARRAGVLPLFGIELITVVEPLRAAGIRVNDPANPGRMYLCGKGVDPFRELSDVGLGIASTARAADEARARTMVGLLRDRFAAAGLATSLDGAAIVDDVAERSGVPRAWVVLQERHTAMAFQEALFLQLPPERRRAVLERAFGGPSTSAVEDPFAVQAEIRSRLIKAGCPAFVPETPLSFEDGYRLVLEWGGIPTYPTLADGTDPVCQWEEPPAALAERLLERGIHLAELIPVRNEPAVVDAYVAAFRAAGIAVTAGTEHNTPERIPMAPACRGRRPISEAARAAFREGSFVVAAHQHRRASGLPGFVDGDGRPTAGFADDERRIRWFAELGARIMAGEEVA